MCAHTTPTWMESTSSSYSALSLTAHSAWVATAWQDWNLKTRPSHVAPSTDTKLKTKLTNKFWFPWANWSQNCHSARSSSLKWCLGDTQPEQLWRGPTFHQKCPFLAMTVCTFTNYSHTPMPYGHTPYATLAEGGFGSSAKEHDMITNCVKGCTEKI